MKKINVTRNKSKGKIIRNNQKGIALVALVITIITIIILATVAINFTFGDNGLINRAEQAKDFYANDTKYTEESETNVESFLDEMIAGTGESGEDTPTSPDIPGGEEAIEKGAITFANPIWTGGKASVTISTNTSYTLQYQVVAGEGASSDVNWQALPQGGVIGNLNHNDTVYARLIQDSYYGEEASTTVKDTMPPIISNITTSNITTNSITVTVTASDGQSGLAASGTYKYYLNDAYKVTNTIGSYAFTGLSAETPYTIKVEVSDKANNVVTETTTASTIKDPNSVENILNAGDYVTYPSTQGDLACRVLYDSSSGYGVQLITSGCVGSDIELGSSTFSASMTSYNNAVTILNNAAGNYNNSTYSARARCVGSHPTSTTDNPGYFTSSESYMSSYNGQLKNTDTNYEIDYNKMGTLGIRNISDIYWLASRDVFSNFDHSYFYVRCVDSKVSYDYLCGVTFGDRGPYGYSYSYGLRPVFILETGIKVTGGDGKSSETAYTLGV